MSGARALPKHTWLGIEERATHSVREILSRDTSAPIAVPIKEAHTSRPLTLWLYNSA